MLAIGACRVRVTEAEQQQIIATAQAPKLQSGEKIRITIYNEPSLSGDFQIDPSGFVSLPLAGTTKAVGLTQDERERALVQKYANPKLPSRSLSIPEPVRRRVVGQQPDPEQGFELWRTGHADGSFPPIFLFRSKFGRHYRRPVMIYHVSLPARRRSNRHSEGNFLVDEQRRPGHGGGITRRCCRSIIQAGKEFSLANCSVNSPPLQGVAQRPPASRFERLTQQSPRLCRGIFTSESREIPSGRPNSAT